MFKHLLVALDGSACSERALDAATAMAAGSGARLTLWHAVEPLAYVASFESAMNALDEIRSLMREAGERLLAQAGAKAHAQGVQADAVLCLPAGPQRPLWERVNEQAGASGADLIVLGSHGRRGASRALLGSDAEQIVRHSRLPVLVVKDAPVA